MANFRLKWLIIIPPDNPFLHDDVVTRKKLRVPSSDKMMVKITTHVQGKSRFALQMLINSIIFTYIILYTPRIAGTTPDNNSLTREVSLTHSLTFGEKLTL